MPAPLHQSEIQIGRRLRAFRYAAGLTRAALAQAIEEKQERLETYEAGRVALRWEVFVKLWRSFSLSPAWLATGKGDELLSPEPFEPLILEIPGNEKFSTAYDRVLRQPVSEVLGDEQVTFETLAQFLESGRVASVQALIDYYRGRFGRLLKPGEAQINRAKGPNLPLDDVNQSEHSRPVFELPRDVDDLLDRVRTATAAPGAKKALAEYLGIKQQHLSQWLSPKGKRPSADYALTLLQWLTGAKATQKKTPTEVRTQPARKAKAKHSRETKQSSGPQR